MCIDIDMIYLWIVTHNFFEHLYQSYGPWLTPKFCFHSIFWELLDIFSPNFIYAFILTRSSLGLLHIIFRKIVPELWPFIYAKILFSHSISWETIDRMLQNFIYTYAFILARSSLGLLHIIFLTFVPELWPLIYAEILFPLNILRTNWHIFTKILYMHSNLGL